MGQTVTFDLRKMRDEQQPDRLGHMLPSTLDQGQFHWSTVATPGESRIIGRAEVASRSGHVTASYSCPVCCQDTGPIGGFNPNAYGLSIDGFAQTSSAGQYYDCYFNFYATGIWWTSLSTFDSGVATMNATTEELHGQSAGSTYAIGTFDTVWWDNDGMDCYQRNGVDTENASVDVLAVRFRDAALIDTNRTADFDNFNTANLNIDTTLGPNACGGDNFAIKARFDLPDHSASCCNSASTTFVTLTNSNKFHFIGDGYTFYGNDSPPYVIVNLKRNLDGSGTTNGVRVSVGGSYQSGQSYTGQGTVHLVCP